MAIKQKTQSLSDAQTPTDGEIPASAWSNDAAELAAAMDVDPAQGLSADEVQRRRKAHGPNRLRDVQQRGLWDIFVDQVKSLIVVILVAAAAVAIAFGDYIDAAAIGVVLLLNTAIGFFTELRARRSMEALQEMDEVEATVLRDGKKQRIPAEEIVPGDVIVIEAGEMVTADLRILRESKMQADESVLTGESVPVDKAAEPVGKDATLAERRSMLYKGTAVTRGSGTGLAVATGMRTELGEISALVEEAEVEETPLEDRLDELGRRLVWVTLGVLVLVVAAGVAAGRDLRLMVETAIALAVAAVPEGLPIVATVALARGMWRMLRRNALIRKLSSVETLGSTSVICTDKTGTLTENRMTTRRLMLPAGTVELADGKDGASFQEGDHAVDPQEHVPLRAIIETAVLCNDAELDEGKGNVGGTGDPLEIALLRLGRKAGFEREDLIQAYGPEVERDAFDRETKKMATVHETSDGDYLVAVKGAPESVLDACSHLFREEDPEPLDDEKRREWIRRNEELAEDGLRVLALAWKRVPDPAAEPYENLHFLGFLGLLDPPRRDVRHAIDRCQDAGIRVVMMTGDQPATARNVAAATGLVRDEAGKDLEAEAIDVIHGSDLKNPAEASEEERRHIINCSVFARVSPEQKLNLIDLHQDSGSIVAMTGDGVNDAPALKAADIGIAMGERGTQVARESADMILQDDAFTSIVAAVEQGRIIFDNIRKFVVYLLSGNVGEVLAVATAAMLSIEVGGRETLPLLPLQILYLNVLNDVFPALALGIGPGDPAVMGHPPRKSDEPIITRYHWGEIVGYGLVIGVTILGAFFYAIHGLGLERTEVITVSFLTLSITRLLHVFNMRRADTGVISNEITRNGWVWGALALCVGLLFAAVYWTPLASILQVAPPGAAGWTVVLCASLVPLVIGQIYLLFNRQE